MPVTAKEKKRLQRELKAQTDAYTLAWRKAVARHCRETREDLDLSRVEFAERVGWSRWKVTALEHKQGRYKQDLGDVMVYARIGQVPYDEFMSGLKARAKRLLNDAL